MRWKSIKKLGGERFDMDTMEAALKRKREDPKATAPAVTTEYEETTPPAPPKTVAGTTADKDAIVAAPRGGQ